MMRKLLGGALCAAVLGVCPLSWAEPTERDRTEANAARTESLAIVVAMEWTSRRVLGDLGRARRLGDAGAVSCVDVLLSQVDVALRNARDRSDRVRAASARGDAGEARRALALVRELRTMQKQLAARADACLGPRARDSSAVDVTTVKLTVDPTLPPISL